MTTDSNLLIEIDARGVARLTLNRPEVHNAFDESLIDRIARAVARLGADAAVRVVVIAATGKVFCAGADIAWMQRAASNDFAGNLDDARRFAAMMSAIDRCPKPVVARIQGPAYGGGVGIACAADIAICGHAARFSVSEARFGILPAVIGPHLMNAIGVRQARRLALTCETIDAAQALAIGLVHQAVEDPQLDLALEACICDLLRAGPQAQGHIQALFARLDRQPVSDEIQQFTAQTISRVRTTAEAREGFEAFVQKRRPSWTSGV
jgi:methylglutaconyl-CoA hydratase